MKVTIVSHSDVLGGAGMVSYRLMQALRNEGVDARMVVYTKISDDPMVAQVSNRTMRGWRFMWERFVLYMANGHNRRDLFKVSIANTGCALHRHPWVKDADVIVLGWVNQGLLSLKGLHKLGKLGKPIVWTLHDMWALTGICHHAYECGKYTGDCGSCMFLAGEKPDDLAHKTQLLKRQVYGGMPNLTFVPVSNWLAGLCRNSALLKDKPVEVIPNAFPVDFFTPHPEKWADDVNLPEDRPNRVIMCAARLDDPIKGLPMAVEAFNHIFDNHPEMARTMTVVFVGDIRDRSVLDNLRLNYHCVGPVHDARVLRQLYAGAQVVLSTSLYETLPGTLIEGQACGCIPVTFGRGGQEDFIRHKQTGYIAEYKNPVSIAEGIMWGIEHHPDRDKLHDNVVQLFSASAVAHRYLSLFDRLLNRRDG